MNTKLDILRLPLWVVLNAYTAYSGFGSASLGTTPAAQKTAAAEHLAKYVDDGSITLQWIGNHPNMAPAAPAAASSTGPSLDGVISATKKLSNELRNQIVDAAIVASDRLDAHSNVIDKHANDINSIKIMIDTTNNAIEATAKAFEAKVSNLKIDDRKVQEEVTRIVADAFKPIRAAIEEAGLQEEVGEMVAVRVIDRKPCKEVFGVAVRDRNGDDAMVDIWNDAAPPVDPNFIWTEGILAHLILSQDTGENAWFGGPKGTGKSETASQFAACTGRAFKRVNFRKYTASEDYIGAVGLENGATLFRKGDFLSAFTHPSSVILLDEISNAPAGELAPLNALLEPNCAVSIGGQVHRRAAGVLVFAADNTFGNGDDSGRYTGTGDMNSSLLDRFARVVPFTYLPFDKEVEAVVRHTKCDPLLAEHIIEAVCVARGKVTTGEVIDAPSIRSVVAFIRALKMLNVEQAWTTTIAARQPAESISGLEAIFASHISAITINKYL
jgi:MoxR-like ATPase